MMPRKIAFGENAAREFSYPKNSLVITTTTPDIYDKWLTYMGIEDYEVYHKVTPDPSIESVEAIRKELMRGRRFRLTLGWVEEVLWTYVNIWVS